MIEVSSPFPRMSAPRIWVWSKKILNSLFDDATPRQEDEFVEHWLRQIDQHSTWAVQVNGELGGIVVAIPAQGAMRISSVFKPAHWGKAPDALRSIYAELFDAGVEEIHSPVFAHNRALQSVLRSLGAQQRARFFRATTTAGGRPADVILMVTTKEAFDAHSTVGNRGAVGGSVHRLGAGQPQEEADAENHDHDHADVRPGGSATAA